MKIYENLGHLGGITCTEVEPHTKEQCAWVVLGGKELLVGALMLWVFGREMRAIGWLTQGESVVTLSPVVGRLILIP